jgi:plasmid stabilization system protein ParE
MIRYSVEVTAAALTAIAAQARYIAEEARAPENARLWLELIRDAVDSLERAPRRASRAEEDAYVEYEVRQLVVGGHLLLFTIDDEHRTVWIVGLRHRHRLPRPEDLPSDRQPRGSDDAGS